MNTSCQSGLRHMRTTIPSALANRASARPAPCAHAFPPPLRSIKRPKPLPAHPSLPPSPTPPPPPLSSRRSVHHHARMKLRSRAGPIILLQGARRSIPTPIRCSAHEPIPSILSSAEVPARSHLLDTLHLRCFLRATPPPPQVRGTRSRSPGAPVQSSAARAIPVDPDHG